jgi:hypothetical protein
VRVGGRGWSLQSAVAELAQGEVEGPLQRYFVPWRRSNIDNPPQNDLSERTVDDADAFNAVLDLGVSTLSSAIAC